MAQFIIRSEKWFNETRNGVNFDLNLANFTQNFKANVGEKVKYVSEFELINYIEFDVDTNPILNLQVGDSVGINNNITINSPNNEYSWENLGFRIGDTVQIYNGNVLILSVVIDTISTNKIWTLVPFAPFQFVQTGSIRGTSRLEFFNFDWDLVSNINGTIQDYLKPYFNNAKIQFKNSLSTPVGTGVVRSTAFVNFIAEEYNNWNNGNFRMRFVSSPNVYTQRFEIEHIFIVQRIKDGDLSIPSSPNIPFRWGSINYYYIITSPITNGTPIRQVGSKNNVGDVGWFNENFDGGINNYSLVSLQYYNVNTNEIVDKIIVKNTTRVTAEINGVGFVALQPLTISHSRIPEDGDIQNLDFNYGDIFINDSLRNVIGAVSNSSSIIQNLSITLINPTKIQVQFDLVYNPVNIIKDKDNYILYIALENNALTPLLSNRVSLYLDYNKYNNSADDSTMFEVTKFEVYDHVKDLDIDTPTTNYVGYVEDGILLDIEFKHKSFDIINNQVLNFDENQIQFICYDQINNKYIIIGRIIFNSTAIDTDGSYKFHTNWSISLRPNYKLIDSDQFFLKEVNYVNNDGVYANYRVKLGLKISWQEIIPILLNIQAFRPFDNFSTQFNGADFNVNLFLQPFFNGSQLNNGKNLLSSNYNSMPQYLTRFLYIGRTKNIINDGTSTDFLTFSPSVLPSYYDTDSNYTATKILVDEDDVDLGDSLLIDEKNKVIFTFDDGSIKTDLAFFEGIIRIEIKNQAGYDIYELSTFREPPLNNILVGIDNQFCKKEIVGGKYTLSCYIDGSQIVGGLSYKVTGRIFDIEPVYNPSLDADLDAWYDATGLIINTDNSYGTVDGAGIISNWKNLKGDITYNLIQPINGRRPTFDSLNLYVTSGGASKVLFFNNKNFGTQFTIFAVVDSDSNGQQNIMHYNKGDNTAFTEAVVFQEFTNVGNPRSQMVSYQGNSPKQVTIPVDRAVGKAIVQYTNYYGNDWYLKANNVRYDVPDNLQNTPNILLDTIFSVGNLVRRPPATLTVSLSSNRDFRFHEILIFTNFDISAKEEEIYLYLKDKWNL